MNSTSRRVGFFRLAAAGAAAALGLILVTGSPAPQALADPVSDRQQNLDRQITDLRETLEGTAKDLVDAVVNLRLAQADLVGAQATLQSTRSALAQAKLRDDALAGQLAVAEAEVAKARRDLGDRQQEEAATRTRLGGIARETYVSSGFSGLSIALNAQSPQQFADRVTVADTALRQQDGTIARLEVEQADTRARQFRLVAASSVVAALKRQSEVVVQQRSAATTAADLAAAKVTALVSVERRSVGTIAARKSAERKRVAALQVEQDRLTAILKARAAAQLRTNSGQGSGGATFSPRNGSGPLSRPVNDAITSGYGMRYHPILHYWRLHSGVDFRAACGTPVHAAAAGTIVRTGVAGGYGNQVVVDHGMIRGADIATSYNHLSRFLVRSGTVRRGQTIAYSGTTGLSTGCHLHFEVYVNGNHVDPMGWL
jgi:murein DD-endopeptidase MepM/ murein hydrolase activator NlpD